MATQDEQKTKIENYEKSFARIKNIIKAGNILCEKDFNSLDDEYKKNFKTNFEDLQDGFYYKETDGKYNKERPLFKQTTIEDEQFEKMENILKKGLAISSMIATTPKLIEKVCTTFNIKLPASNTNEFYCIDEMASASIKNPTVTCAIGGKKRRNKSRKTGKKRGRKHTKKQRR